MEEKAKNGLIVPTNVLWKIAISVIVGFFAAYITFRSQLDILKIQVDRNTELFNEINNSMKELNLSISNIEKELIQKQDKKFIE
jgi:hypothetical protein